MVRDLFQRLLRRLPSQCAVCHRWPVHPICEACVVHFGQPVPRCQTCALPVLRGMRRCGACIVAPPPIDQCLAAVTYTYPWAGLVQEFKFHEHTAWARSFGALLRSAPWVEPALEAADWVLPLPLSKERLQWRGFNQALLLARALEPDKVTHDLLLRIKDTPPQSSLPRHERLGSVQGAFAVDPLLVSRLKDRRVVLVDDVMTSGASLHAAAKVLRQAGAAHITGLVFARTE
ncbi:MAG: ComF family protein [Rhodoferax sp.]|nr:ComF family protein [Rhodoferax sp.]